MTGEQLLNLLMFRLGYRTNAVIRSAALLEMQLAQTLLEGEAFKPWFLEAAYIDPTFVTSPDVGSVVLPDGFLGLNDDVHNLYYISLEVPFIDRYIPINRAMARFMQNYFRGEPAGPPQEWDLLDAALIILRPTPDAVYTLSLRAYWAQPTITDTSVENLWSQHAPDWLLAKTLEQVAVNHLGDTELALKAAADVQIARRRVYGMHEQRAHGGRTYEMGSD